MRSLAFFLLLLAPAAGGQDTKRKIERFELFNSCRPVYLSIESLDSDAADIGLTVEAVQAAAESRLRAARLYTDSLEEIAWTDGSLLSVTVSTGTSAFSVSVEYYKAVTDSFGEDGIAVTWSTASHGTHGGSANFIMSSLSQHLDKFLAAYLRVNEAACGSGSTTP